MNIIYSSKLTLDALSEEVYYDRVSKRYKYKSNNTFASRKDVISLQEKFLARKEKELVNMASRIKAGEIGVYQDLTKTLKQIHISNAIIQKGGIDRLTESDLGTIGNILKKQYYAGKDEKTGKPYGLKYLLQDSVALSEAQIRQRLNLYAESGKLSGSVLRRNEAKNIGLMYAQRFLSPVENCKDCVYYASLGRQLIDFLPLPKTQCVCRSNCRCKIEYYRTETSTDSEL